MILDELYEIAAKRTKGEWQPIISHDSNSFSYRVYHDADAVFIKMCSVHFDSLIEFARASKAYVCDEKSGEKELNRFLAALAVIEELK